MTPDSDYTIALIPGMQCTAATFAGVAARLEDRLGPAVRVETMPVSAASLDRAVERLLDLGRYVVPVGHSLGGTVAMAAARLAPERVPALATVCANPRGPRPTQRTGWQDHIFRVARGGFADCVDELLPRLCGPTADPDVRATTRAMMEETGPTGYLRQLHIQQQRVDERPALATYTGSVLAIGAEHDRLVSPASAHEIADTAPRGRATIVADAGHMLPLERPAVVADAVADWIDDLRGATVGVPSIASDGSRAE